MITFIECNVGYCFSPEDIDNFITTSEIRAYIINKYYDFNDIENPIKSYLDESRVEWLHPGIRKRHKLNIRENRVVQNDGIYPWSQQKNNTFYSVSTSTSTFKDRVENNDNYIIDFEISLDPQVDIYERQVYTLFSFFSEIGGIFELFQIFGHIFVCFINKSLAKVSMINHVRARFSQGKKSRAVHEQTDSVQIYSALPNLYPSKKKFDNMKESTRKVEPESPLRHIGHNQKNNEQEDDKGGGQYPSDYQFGVCDMLKATIP